MLYHGTESLEAFKAIKKEGFKANTYFTPFLDTALSYGGEYIFAVDIEHKDYEVWEVIMREPVPAEKILYAQHFSFELMYHNKEALYNRDKARHEKDGRTICDDCKGQGEYRDEKFSLRHLETPGGGSFRTREDPCISCNTCHGRGYNKNDTD